MKTFSKILIHQNDELRYEFNVIKVFLDILGLICDKDYVIILKMSWMGKTLSRALPNQNWLLAERKNIQLLSLI